jgi:hypothetical protein
MAGARSDIRGHAATASQLAGMAAEGAKRITRDNAALLALAVSSLEHSAELADEIADRAERHGRPKSAATARANASRARRAARTRLALSV